MNTAIIIGAGPAGLTAAYELLKNGYSVIVIEKSNCVGGLCRCGNLNGNLCDLGGHRFFSDNDRINALWKEFLDPYGDPDEKDNILMTRERHSSIYFEEKLFDYPVTEKIFSQLGASLTVKSGMSLLGTAFIKHSEDNLEGYLINRFGKTLYDLFFKEYTRKLWGIPPSEISPDWGRQRIKGISLKDALLLPFKKEKNIVSTFFTLNMVHSRCGKLLQKKLLLWAEKLNLTVRQKNLYVKAEKQQDSYILKTTSFISLTEMSFCHLCL